MYMFTNKFNRCNEVGSSEKLKTEIFTKYAGKNIYLIGSAAFEVARKLLTLAKQYKLTRERKIR